jgi:hypothetical protein
MLEPLGPSLWTRAVPHRFLGLEIGTRMNVVRLADGELVVHSPIPLDSQLEAAVRALGPVRHVIAPNLQHHLYVGSWGHTFPEAKVWVASGLERKRQDLPEVSPLELFPRDPDLVHVPIAGTEGRLSENVFVHVPSETLLVSDLIQNLPEAPDAWTRAYTTVMGIHDRVGLSRILQWSVFRDRKAARASLDQVLALPWSRIVPAHGRVIDVEAKARFRETFAFLE